MNKIQEATATKAINALYSTPTDAAAATYKTVNKLSKKDKINICNLQGGFTAFKKSNFITYHQFIRRHKNVFSVNLPSKDDKGRPLKSQDYDLIVSEFKKLYLTQDAKPSRTDKISFKIINAQGGYKNDLGVVMLESNKILMIGGHGDDFIQRTEKIIYDIIQYIKVVLNQESLLIELYDDNHLINYDINELFELKTNEERQVLKGFDFNDANTTDNKYKILFYR